MRILTVCLGNICRSPTAQAALREALDEAGLDGQVAVDSVGTGSYHVGAPPDRRMQAAADREGLRLSGQARQVTPDDLDDADLVLAMDRENLRDLQRLAREDQRDRIRLFRDFDPDAEPGAEVPDPYFGGRRGFEEVVEISRRTARGVVDHIREEIRA